MTQTSRLQIRPLQEVSVTALAHVIVNMREDDAREIYAMRWTDDPFTIVDQLLNTSGNGYLFFYDGIPVAVVGAAFERPGVVNVYMIATNDFPKIGKGMTKFIVKVMIPGLVEAGVHRAHCLALESYHEVHEWLQALGAKRGSTLIAYGRNKENYVYFEWLDREHDNVFRRRKHSL